MCTIKGLHLPYGSDFKRGLKYQKRRIRIYKSKKNRQNHDKNRKN